MRKRKELQNLAVVDVTGGKKLGSVGDLIVSPDDGSILGLTLSGGMLGKSTSFVAVDDVHAIGADAIMVQGEEAVRAESEMTDSIRAARDASAGLTGKKVVTENGALVGTVSDYLIDESALRVTGLTLGGGLLSSEEGIAADRVVSIGPDAIIVTDEAGEATTEGGTEAGNRQRSPWASG